MYVDIHRAPGMWQVVHCNEVHLTMYNAKLIKGHPVMALHANMGKWGCNYQFHLPVPNYREVAVTLEWQLSVV